MKKLFLTFAIAIACVSCNKYDELYDMIYSLGNRVDKIEQQCSQMNTNISGLQALVDALSKHDYITGVAPIKEGNEITGYTITFAFGAPITLWNGQDGKDGKDGNALAISVKKDIDGNYYWTVDGNWVIGADGNKVRANGTDGIDGVTPLLKIEDNFWYVSFDGINWQKLGLAVGDGGQAFFSNVAYDDDYVYITLADGTRIDLPRKPQSNIISFTMNISQDGWMYSNLENNNFFWASFDMPEITEDVFDNGLIKIYRTYDFTSANPVQIELPNVRQAEYQISGDDWGFYTEVIDYEISIGSVTIFYTASDFDYELNEEFIPDDMEFRCVILR